MSKPVQYVTATAAAAVMLGQQLLDVSDSEKDLVVAIGQAGVAVLILAALVPAIARAATSGWDFRFTSVVSVSMFVEMAAAVAFVGSLLLGYVAVAGRFWGYLAAMTGVVLHLTAHIVNHRSEAQASDAQARLHLCTKSLALLEFEAKHIRRDHGAIKF